jgi:hypothetical protein
LLPVKHLGRIKWKTVIPRSIKNSLDDSVSYHAVPKDPEPDFEEGKRPNRPGRACYASIRPDYDQWNISCVPKNEKIISLEDVLTFFNTFTELGIIPEGIEIREEENGVHCHIPAAIGNPHSVYIALTLYRWVDSHPRLVWEFLRIMEREDKRHPLQILPYLLDKNVTNFNHSFISLREEYNPRSVVINPLIGLAAKLYFDPESNFGCADFKRPGRKVNDAIEAIVQSICPMFEWSLSKKGVPPWSRNSRLDLKYALAKPIDNLNPALYEMYTLSNPSRKTILDFLESHFTLENSQT